MTLNDLKVKLGRRLAASRFEAIKLDAFSREMLRATQASTNPHKQVIYTDFHFQAEDHLNRLDKHLKQIRTKR